MNQYKQKSVKELYRSKEVLQVLLAIVCAVTAAVFFANFVTSYAGI
jgi:hypothetical protein